MGELQLADLVGLAALGLGGATLAILLIAWLEPVTRGLHHRFGDARRAVFLFHGNMLADANLAALRHMGATTLSRVSLADFATQLAPDFPDLPASLAQTSAPRRQRIRGLARGQILVIDRTGSTIRVSVSSPGSDPKLESLPPVQTLAKAIGDAPCLAWQTGQDGSVWWSNATYQATARNIYPDADPARVELFDPTNTPDPGGTPRRVSLARPNDHDASWFDVSSTPCGDTVLSYAVPADAAVRAEMAQRNLVQTLTKTFAQLSIGLAIFDRNRQLALFNPALIDLTDLPAEFLSARPNLLTFFDRLRENRMIPEPKNYSSWREQIADLVVAATDDRYCENWTLPSGLTYRVVGRPHPDGAIAFLFEDISAEISLTRRFRAELDLNRSVLDTVETAMAVFTADGSLTLSNRAYRALWGHDKDRDGDKIPAGDVAARWAQKAVWSDAWDGLSAGINRVGERRHWSRKVHFQDGRTFTASLAPITGGASLVSFSDDPGPTGQRRRRTGELPQEA